MARKTAGDKSDKGSASADKHAGEKTPIDPPKNTQEPEHLEWRKVGVMIVMETIKEYNEETSFIESDDEDDILDPVPEPYTPTGNFEADFCELAIRAGFPTMQVVARPHRPPTPTPTPPETAPVTGKGDKDKNSVKEEAVKPDEGVCSGEPEDPPPTTYRVKEKYSYFKPRVEVEVEEEGPNKTHVKEIYMRGWKIDDRILEILTVTLPPLEKLTKLDMWNNCLTDNSLNILANAVQNLQNLRTLCLDNNPLTLQRYGVLLQGEECKLQNLSLRNCYINNMGAQMIGNALATNKSLVTLNLCFNKIKCEGAEKLVKGLRMNRTLLSVNLGSNLISDAGASKIAEVISSFSLSHEEIIARRLLISKKTPEDSTSPTRSLNAPAGGSKERPASVRSGGHLGKEEKKSREKDKSKKKDGKKQEEKAKKSASNESVKAQAKVKKALPQKSDKKGTQQAEQEPEVVEFPNPLLEIPIKEENGEIVIPGNRALININLSRNKIGEIGVEAFLIAVQRQLELISGTSKPTGLMRLTLARNLFSPDNGSYQRLMEIMHTRDPFYKLAEQLLDDTITTIKEDP